MLISEARSGPPPQRIPGKNALARDLLGLLPPMRAPILKLLSLVALFFVFGYGTLRGSIVWTYDFPGSPGSGVGNNQTNPQPTGATFGDWARVNLTAGTASDAFESTFWNNTAVFDPTQYESFTITADAGYHLNLEQLTFDEMRTSGGPTKGHIEMFLNGSSAPWAVFNYNPSSNWNSHTFDFTDTTDSDNVTLVEFRFYGWNGGTPDAGLLFDNVAVTLSAVPEVPNLGAVILVIGCAVLGRRFRGVVPRRESGK